MKNNSATASVVGHPNFYSEFDSCHAYDCLLESIQHKATDQANPFVFTDKQEVNDIYKANRQAAKLSVD